MLWILSGAALASGNYPGTVAEELTVNAPSCALCHVGVTTLGTVTTPFGMSMLDAGLVASDPDSLVVALATLESEGTDSDGDGVGDIDELIDGTDPNGTGDRVEGPDYGCVGSTRPGKPKAGAALLALLAGVLLRSGSGRARR